MPRNKRGAPGRRGLTTSPRPLPKGATLVTHPAMLDVPRELIRFAAGLLRAGRAGPGRAPGG